MIRTIFLLFFFIGTTNSSVYLFNSSKNIYDTIPSKIQSGLLYVSLVQFCESLGYDWQWDKYSERFEILGNESAVTLIQNNNFYKVNESTFQLIYPPHRVDGNLYVFSKEATKVFSYLKNYKITWSDSDTLYTISKKDIKNVDAKNNSNTSSNNTLDNFKQKKLTIVIDPGHGGRDPGAIGQNKTKEKNVVLGIGLALRDALKKDTTIKVFMTRSKDKFIPLGKRTEIANNKQADLFISIHANSIAGSKARKNEVKGYKIYFLSQAKNEADKLVAMRENSVIELEKDVPKKNMLQNILIEMANNEFLTQSQELSILIAESIKSTVPKIKTLHKGVGQANFWVLNGAFMPSVLVEACFISNPTEEKKLKNKKFQKKIALAIKKAIIQFKKKYEAGL